MTLRQDYFAEVKIRSRKDMLLVTKKWVSFSVTIDDQFREYIEDLIEYGLGGALGAVARYAISLIPVKTGFPVLILITNIIGAIQIGFIVGVTSSKEGISDNTVLFWKTGVCGGFTTFSTFSLEAFNLFDNKQYAAGSIYVILSCGCCILGILCGKKIASVIKF